MRFSARCVATPHRPMPQPVVSPRPPHTWWGYSPSPSSCERLYRLALATLGTLLAQTPASLGSLAHLYRRSQRNPLAPHAQGTVTQAGLRYLWQRWSAYLSLLSALGRRRCPFLFVSLAYLRPLAEALSWHSWGGSLLSWQTCRALATTPLCSLPPPCRACA